MSDMEKILRETEKALHVEYQTLSGLTPTDRRIVFSERLHGTHVALLSVNFVINGDDLDARKDADEKIRELINALMEENCEKYWEEAKNESKSDNEG